MIDIYLNPHNELIFSSASNDASYTSSADNIRAAETLLQELQAKESDTTIAECNILIHSKKKENVESAQKRLNEILSKNKEYVPALVLMALCKFILKKSNDARNFLKIVQKKNY